MTCKKIKVQTRLCPKNHPCPSVRRCPVNAIIQDNPFSAPYIDENKCIHCGMCTKMCPVFKCASA